MSCSHGFQNLCNAVKSEGNSSTAPTLLPRQLRCTAAVTAVILGAMAMPAQKVLQKTLVFDRPFALLLCDLQTGPFCLPAWSMNLGSEESAAAAKAGLPVTRSASRPLVFHAAIHENCGAAERKGPMQ